MIEASVLISAELMGRPRINLTVSEDIYEFLSEWAEREERPLANLAAYLLSQAVRERQKELRKQKSAADATEGKNKEGEE